MDPTAAWAALLRVHATLTPVLDQELQAAHGLPLTWYDVLLELNAAPDRSLTMTRLGQVAVVSRSRVSRVVDEMERAGLVRRESDPDDRRGSYAVITDDGRTALRKAAPVYLQGIDEEFLVHLTGAERKALERSLTKVLDAHRGEPAGP